MISQLVRASTLALVCVAALATESPARTPFDGAWSVLIVTTQGDCDRAYRYGVTIDNGNVGPEPVSCQRAGEAKLAASWAGLCPTSLS